MRDCEILAITATQVDGILEEYQDVLGELPGEYRIVTDDSVQPKVHPPQRVPVEVRSRMKRKLDELAQRNVITPVFEPTEWVSSMLVVTKPNKIRICLDPRDLNEVIKREQYQMPTIEEVATRLNKARKFTVVYAKATSGRKSLIQNRVTRRRSRHRSGATVGFGCLLTSVQHQKCGKEQCMNLSKD